VFPGRFPGGSVPDGGPYDGGMTSNRPDPDDEVPDLAYGRLYGRAPSGDPTRGGSGSGGGPGRGLRTAYTFVLVWATTALIVWFTTVLFGAERGDTGAAVLTLVVSLAAAVAITAWSRRRGR
jgi:hypothetical protein